MLEEEEEAKVRTRDGDIDGSHRPKNCVEGFENEWPKRRTIALVWREDEQSEDYGWQASKRFHPTFLPCPLTRPDPTDIFSMLINYKIN